MEIENIKFKAKRLDNGEWIIGSFVVMKIPALSKTTIGIVEAGGATLHEIDPVTVCQFTGMKDKNGVEVWEHDLLTKDYSVIYEVGYEVIDPPHLLKVGQNSWLCKKYGKLPENWQAFINDSIHEGMRVLKTNGTLIFKWNEQQIKVSDVLKAITDYKPIFGHRTTIKNQTIWMAFMK